MPFSIEEGRVPDESVRVVINQLQACYDALIDKLDVVDKAEVTGVGHEDFISSGPADRASR